MKFKLHLLLGNLEFGTLPQMQFFIFNFANTLAIHTVAIMLPKSHLLKRSPKS